jgi:hypothetical protein
MIVPFEKFGSLTILYVELYSQDVDLDNRNKRIHEVNAFELTLFTFFSDIMSSQLLRPEIEKYLW